jgi:hypothetical protein
MARIRAVKPEFWADEGLAEQASRDARLLYIGLWNLADEHGRLRGDPRYIKGQVFPYDDDLSAADVEVLLKSLAAAKKVVRYTRDGGRYVFLPNLAKHQRLESEKVPSKLPAPPPDGADESAHDESAGPDESERGPGKSARGADDSEPNRTQDRAQPSDQDKHAAQIGADLSAPGAEKKLLSHGTWNIEHGTESMGQGGASAPRADKPRTTRGERLPDNFVITPEMRTWAREKVPTVNIDSETERFSDYWRGVPGAKGVKSDWPGTWRNWMRRTQDDHSGRGPRASPGSNGHQSYPGRTDPAIYHEDPLT